MILGSTSLNEKGQAGCVSCRKTTSVRNTENSNDHKFNNGV